MPNNNQTTMQYQADTYKEISKKTLQTITKLLHTRKLVMAMKHDGYFSFQSNIIIVFMLFSIQKFVDIILNISYA